MLLHILNSSAYNEDLEKTKTTSSQHLHSGARQGNKREQTWLEREDAQTR